MFRKFAVAMLAVVIAVGTGFAEDIKGAFVKFADGKLTIKVDDKDKEFKIPADLKMKRKGKDGNETEVSVSDSLTKMNDSKFKPTVVVTVEKDNVTAVKYEFMRKKKDN